MNKYKFAVLGNGYMAARHLKSLDASPRAAAAVVVNRGMVIRSTDASEAGATLGSETNICDYLAGRADIDAVMICTPDHTHAAFVNRLLPTGKLIFCEKPLARTEAEFRDIDVLASAPAAGRIAVGMNCRFRHRIRRLKELAESESFGTIRLVNAAYFSNIGVVLDGKAKGWWFDFPEGCAPFLHGGAIHLFDALRYILGNAQSVVCLPASGASGSRLGGETFMVLVRFASGVAASVSISGTSLAPNRFQICIDGEKFAVDEANEYQVVSGGAAATVGLPSDDYGDLDRQLAHLVDVLDGNAQILNSLEEATKNFDLVRACEASLATQSWAPVRPARGITETQYG